jgi:D-psicose/D-tagatose/L-ribulose 3-epimerase
MAPGRDLTSGDSCIVASTQKYLRSCIDAAAVVGARVVAGPIYAPTGVTGIRTPEERRDAIAAVAGNLGPVLDHARARGVRLAVEPLNRFETSLFNTVEQTLELIRIVDRRELGLLLDTFHMNIEERSQPAAIRTAGEALFHFHACGNDRGAPGRDTIDWPGIRSALTDIEYRGAISIESFTSANRSIATAASIWRDLAPSQDELATTGLLFVKNVLISGD